MILFIGTLLLPVMDRGGLKLFPYFDPPFLVFDLPTTRTTVLLVCDLDSLLCQPTLHPS
jgi:hypothetical protein